MTNDSQLIALAKRYSIAVESISKTEIKSSLLAALIKKHSPHFSNILIPQIKAMPQSQIDQMLEQLIHDDLAVDPIPKRTTSGIECKIQTFGSIQTKLKLNPFWSAERAAKEISKKGQNQYKSAKVLRDRYFQNKKLVANLQKVRDASREKLLSRLLNLFSNDSEAMFLWSSFCISSTQLYDAHENKNLEAERNAEKEVDVILSSEHPFATVLSLLYAPIEHIWQLSSVLLDSLTNANEKDKLKAALSLSELDEDKTIVSLITLLQSCGVVPPEKSGTKFDTSSPD